MRIEFFFEASCGNCERVDNEILPELDGCYPGFYILERRDVFQMTNYLRLAGYQERLKRLENEDVSMVLDGKFFLNGFQEIRANLFNTMDELLSVPAALDSTAAPPPATMEVLRDRARRFTPLGVMAAGFVDGLNPCAISTLVFFMSLLATFQIGGRKLLLAGGAFCAASFLTYLALGLGLLRALHVLSAFGAVRAAIDLAMVGLLMVLALLSFIDAWRFAKGRDPNQIALRLPRLVTLWIHALMRRGLKNRHLVLSGAGLGVIVTALESVCTGQVYVPTLVMVIRSGSSAWQAAAYLVAYNLLFIMPLVIILGMTWKGLKTTALLEWSRSNVVLSKCLLGILFLALAALLMIL